jgi:hypothetical protein
VRAALERAGHGEVELGGHGGAAAMETACAATPDGERWPKRVKEVRKGEVKLGVRAIGWRWIGGDEFGR